MTLSYGCGFMPQPFIYLSAYALPLPPPFIFGAELFAFGGV